METHEFTHDDWQSFQGAEGWASTDTQGTLPLIATGKFESGKEYVVVFDRTGACLLVEDDAQNMHGGWQLFLSFPCQAAALAFAKGIGEPKCADEFFKLGFEAN